MRMIKPLALVCRCDGTAVPRRRLDRKVEAAYAPNARVLRQVCDRLGIREPVEPHDQVVEQSAACLLNLERHRCELSSVVECDLGLVGKRPQGIREVAGHRYEAGSRQLLTATQTQRNARLGLADG